MWAFEKCLLESASLNSAELTENGVQLVHRSMSFFSSVSDPYAMTLTLKNVGWHIVDTTQQPSYVVQVSSLNG